MTQATHSHQQLPRKLKPSQEFVFVSDSAMKLVPETNSQLQLPPHSSWLDWIELEEMIIIEQIYAPHDIIHQLKDLGFEPHRTAKLLSRTEHGSVIVELDNILLGIGKEIVRQTVVTVVGERK